VSIRSFVVTRLHAVKLIVWLASVTRSMAVGLGVTPEEWEELKGNVDDSFWVLRVIGSSISPPFGVVFEC